LAKMKKGADFAKHHVSQSLGKSHPKKKKSLISRPGPLPEEKQEAKTNSGREARKVEDVKHSAGPVIRTQTEPGGL